MGKHFPQDFPKRPRPTTSTSLQRAAKSPKAHLPAADAEPPSNLEGLLLWSEGAVKPLLEQVCQGMPEAERVAALKQWFTAVAKYVLPDQLGYVTVGQRPGRRPQK